MLVVPSDQNFFGGSAALRNISSTSCDVIMNQICSRQSFKIKILYYTLKKKKLPVLGKVILKPGGEVKILCLNVLEHCRFSIDKNHFPEE